MSREWIGVWFVLVLGLLVMGGIAQEPGDEVAPVRGGILVVEESVRPVVVVRWVGKDGIREALEVLPYTAPVGGEAIGGEDENVLAYVTVGGTRVETGAGHPNGLVLRVGLTKQENARPFFEDIVPGSFVEIDLLGAELSQPVKEHTGTGLMHLKYALGDLEACSIPGTARNQYLLSDPEDTLGGRVIRDVNATPGALSGIEGMGSIDVTVRGEDSDIVDVRVRVPYGLLRHLQDPWASDLPNTFFEPIHLHMEVEMLPEWAPPYDRVWTPEVNTPEEGESGDDADSSEDDS